MLPHLSFDSGHRHTPRVTHMQSNNTKHLQKCISFINIISLSNGCMTPEMNNVKTFDYFYLNTTVTLSITTLNQW